MRPTCTRILHLACYPPARPVSGSIRRGMTRRYPLAIQSRCTGSFPNLSPIRERLECKVSTLLDRTDSDILSHLNILPFLLDRDPRNCGPVPYRFRDCEPAMEFLQRICPCMAVLPKRCCHYADICKPTLTKYESLSATPMSPVRHDASKLRRIASCRYRVHNVRRPASILPTLRRHPDVQPSDPASH
jgi:hypothetical protein